MGIDDGHGLLQHDVAVVVRQSLARQRDREPDSLTTFNSRPLLDALDCEVPDGDIFSLGGKPGNVIDSADEFADHARFFAQFSHRALLEHFSLFQVALRK
jgi:hypothetical protein